MALQKIRKLLKGIFYKVEPKLTERSMAAVITGLPSLNQVMVGVGSPSALHPKVTGSFLATAVSSGCSVILGAAEEAKLPAEQENKSILFYKVCT